MGTMKHSGPSPSPFSAHVDALWLTTSQQASRCTSSRKGRSTAEKAFLKPVWTEAVIVLLLSAAKLKVEGEIAVRVGDVHDVDAYQSPTFTIGGGRASCAPPSQWSRRQPARPSGEALMWRFLDVPKKHVTTNHSRTGAHQTQDHSLQICPVFLDRTARALPLAKVARSAHRDDPGSRAEAGELGVDVRRPMGKAMPRKGDRKEERSFGQEGIKPDIGATVVLLEA
ncbi:hypothetical protein DFH06DRAFT_1322913 [Mycena polygramma]|nr:hypothetical protein DFH06DRAFT_1322913 [Mycena polygramma]